ncbi:MAG: Eco57I restriction-modification methylase domain-containing protein, partial [Bacilli bacterium]|nr:Eco57I restriction-modification methylase domain-containing protein [Bacilli bacterium]
WETTNIIIPDELFSNNYPTKEGDRGDGILDVFDRYNFTVNENEPLEKEVAVDPEMLGKVFENLLDIKDRKSKGAFYTPREIVHYMCQESLINYLQTETNNEILRNDLEFFIRKGERIIENDKIVLDKQEVDIKQYGRVYENETYKLLLPISLRTNVKRLDELLQNIKVADPAVGSGAFPLGMINEIVRARKVLNVYLKNHISDYELKKHTITHSIYGVDIDPGAVEIAKLRLWLALVVDEETPHPLPNLEYKIMQGNSLISEYEGIKLFDEGIFDKEKKQKAEQLALGLGKRSLDLKMEILQDRIASFVDESQHKKKKKLKEEIDILKWEIIEETLKAQGILDEEKSKKIRDYKKSNTKPFFVWKLEFSDVFKEKGGFDVVIGNPPYVGESGNKEIFRPIARGNLGRFYMRNVDLLYFFFHLALDISKNNSKNAFITTNYYITADGALELRKDLKKRSTILNLINFNELKIFESAKGQHNMITFFEKGRNDFFGAKTVITNRKGDANEKIIQEIIKGTDNETNYYIVKQKNLYETDQCYIRLSGSINIENPISLILNKLVMHSEPLKGIVEINQGLVTGVNKISKSHLQKYNIKAKVGDGVFIYNAGELAQYNLKEGLIKPWFKNSDIFRYTVSKNNKYELVLTNFIKDLSSYKEFEKRLLQFKKILCNRSQMEHCLDWWDLHQIRMKDKNKTGEIKKMIFDGEKIIAPYRSKGNIFGYTDRPWYAASDVYFITGKKHSDIKLKYILALLNSKLYFKWLCEKGKKKGEILELFSKPLSEIPIKKIPSEAQKPFIDLIDQILKITSAPDYNPKKPPIKQKELEKQIDELVYKLYDLTEEEIKIVENSLKNN